MYDYICCIALSEACHLDAGHSLSMPKSMHLGLDTIMQHGQHQINRIADLSPSQQNTVIYSVEV